MVGELSDRSRVDSSVAQSTKMSMDTFRIAIIFAHAMNPVRVLVGVSEKRYRILALSASPNPSLSPGVNLATDIIPDDITPGTVFLGARLAGAHETIEIFLIDLFPNLIRKVIQCP